MKTLTVIGLVYFTGFGLAANYYSTKSIEARDNAIVQRDSSNARLSRLESEISRTKKGNQTSLLDQKRSLRTQIAAYDSTIKAASSDKTKAKNFFKSCLSLYYLAD